MSIDSPNFIRFKENMSNAVSLPFPKFQKKHLKSDLTFSSNPLRRKVYNLLYSSKEKENRIQNLLEALDYCILNLEKYGIGFIKSLDEKRKIVELIVRLDSQCERRNVTTEKCYLITALLFQNLPTKAKENGESEFNEFKSLLAQEKYFSIFYFQKEAEILLNNALEKEKDVEWLLDLLERLYLLDPILSQRPTTTKHFHILFTMILKEIFDHQLSEERWNKVIHQWLNKDSKLCLLLIDFLKNELLELEKKFALSPDLDQIHKAFEKLDVFFSGLEQGLKEKAEFILISFKEMILSLLLPNFDYYGQSEKTINQLSDIFKAFNKILYLDHLFVKAQKIPNLFCRINEKSTELHPTWEKLIDLFSSKKEIFLVFCHKLANKNKNSDFYKQIMSLLQCGDIIKLSSFFSSVFCEKIEPKVFDLLIGRFLKIEKPNLTSFAEKLFQKCKEETSFTELGMRSLLPKVISLLKAAKKENSKEFIECSYKIIGYYFPFYLNFKPKMNIYPEIYLGGWDEMHFYCNPSLPSLEIDDEDLKNILKELDIEHLPNLFCSSKAVLDLLFFPCITPIGIMRLVKKIPNIYFKNGLNNPKYCDIKFTCGEFNPTLVHSGVLACSSFFDAMLFGGDFQERNYRQENQILEITLPAIDFDFFNTWLPLIYDRYNETKKYEKMEVEKLYSHLNIAHYYGITFITEYIDALIHHKISYKNEFYILFNLIDCQMKNKNQYAVIDKILNLIEQLKTVEQLKTYKIYSVVYPILIQELSKIDEIICSFYEKKRFNKNKYIENTILQINARCKNQEELFQYLKTMQTELKNIELLDYFRFYPILISHIEELIKKSSQDAK